jgi:hypothetical protein
MEQSKPSKDILNKIKNEHIIPKSYFQTHWKSYAFWILWIAIMFFGAMSFSLLLLNVLDIRLVFLHELGVGRYLRILIGTMPYFWLTLVIVALGAGYFAMRKTRTGYRYSMLFITTIIVLIISLVGVFLHATKLNKHLGNRMIHNPHMMKMGFPAQERFLQPKEGMLGGRIVEISESEFFVKNVQGNIWKVVHDDRTDIRFRGQKIRVGISVSIIGSVVKENVFHADIIRLLPPHLEHENDMLSEQFSPRNGVKKKDFKE